MHHVMQFLLRHGYPVLFAAVLAEQLGAPIPSVPVLLAMGALIGLGNYSWGGAFALSMAACMIADCTWYLIGQLKGSRVLKLLCKISIEPDSCVSTTRSWFKRLGGWALVIAKFVPGLGTVATPMAGLSHMRWWKFAAADGLGSFLWAGAYLGLGWIFRTQLEDVGLYASRFGGGLVVLVAAVLALWIAFKYYQRRRFMKNLRIARIRPEELLDQLKDAVIIDLRTVEELQEDGAKIPGALWFDRKELEARHTEIPRDRDIILYCT